MSSRATDGAGADAGRKTPRHFRKRKIHDSLRKIGVGGRGKLGAREVKEILTNGRLPLYPLAYDPDQIHLYDKGQKDKCLCV